MWKTALLLAVAFPLVACSDSEEPSDPSEAGSAGSGGAGAGGGAGTSAGSAGAGSGQGGGGNSGAAGTGGKAGGNSGGSGPAPVGAISLNVLPGCALPAGFIDFPSLATGHPVTATDKTGGVTDGGMTPDGQAVKVSCQMNGTTSIDFAGAITIGVGPSSSLAQVSLYPAASGQAADGNSRVSGAVVPQQYGAPLESCINTPIGVDPATGSIWGEFTCPEYESTDGEDVCELGPSYYFFENCPAP